MATDSNPLARKALRTSYISTVVSISLVLFMLGTLGVLVLHAGKISSYVKENLQLSVILLQSASDNEIKRVVAALEKSEAVKEVRVVTKEEAAEAMKKDLGEDFIGFLGYNPLLASLDVKLHAAFTDNASIDKLKEQLGGFTVVKEVYYQQSLIDMVNKNIQTFSLIILGFSALLFVVSAALINNTIRLALYSKRLLIKSMKLVGATRGFIRKPFVISGILQGLLGAVIANVLLAGLLYYTYREIPDLAFITDYSIIAQLMGGVAAAGIVISGLSTLLAVNKYLSRNTADLY